MKLTRLSFALLATFCAGCATTAPQSGEVLSHPNGYSSRAQVLGVPFVDQPIAECGPASLTMAAQWAEDDVRSASLDTIAPMVMTPEKKGSLQQDMIAATRRLGLMGVVITGMAQMLSEIEAGHPVIIFENLGLTWYPIWHYAVVVGYDLRTEEIVAHSGHNAFERTDMRIFERSWKLSGYWGLVVLKPGEIAASAGELANMQAAAGLEQSEYSQAAESSYRAILDRWPSSLSALIGLGNTSYKQGKFKVAVRYLRRAQRLYPESDAVKHNLAVAEAKEHSASVRGDRL